MAKKLISGVYAVSGEDELLSVAYSLERLSEHPLGVGVVNDISVSVVSPRVVTVSS